MNEFIEKYIDELATKFNWEGTIHDGSLNEPTNYLVNEYQFKYQEAKLFIFDNLQTIRDLSREYNLIKKQKEEQIEEMFPKEENNEEDDNTIDDFYGDTNSNSSL